VISIAGLVAIGVLPVAQYPDITPSQVQITATYPGADAKTLQETVVEPIETQVNGVKRMLYMSSTCSDSGTAVITVTCGIGTDGDLNTVNVQNRVNWANAQLPEAVRKQGVIVKEKSSNMLLVICLYSPNNKYDALFLNNYASINIKDEIARIPGVGDCSLLGELKYSMRVWLDPDKMASLQMGVDEVTDAIKAQNAQVSAGAIGEAPSPKDQAFRFTIQTKGRLTSVKEFENIIIRASEDGANVKLKDVGRIERGSESYSSNGQLNGKPAALLAVYQLSDANGLDIADACRKRLKELKNMLPFPEGLDYGIQYDTTDFIKASVDEVVETLYIAVILVVLVTFLFLQDWRSTLVPTIAIPVSLIGTFSVLYAAGFSINLITLFGLILAIGIVVDDAIVVIENINRLMDEEKLPPKEAALKSMEQVTGPVIATTLVLLAMFIPVCFLPGITGELYRQFGVTISVAVVISSINALTLSPALSGLLLIPTDQQTGRNFFIFRWFEAFFSFISNRYNIYVASLVKKAFIVLALYGVLMFITWRIYGVLPTGFIPEEDQGAFFINVQLPDGASLVRTQKVAAKVSDIAHNTPGVRDVIIVNGYSIISGTTASNNALVIVMLKPWGERKKPELQQNYIVNKLQKVLFQIPDALVVPITIPAIPGIGSTGGFSFVMEDTTGTHPHRLSEAANSLIVMANQNPALSRVFTTFSADVPQIYLNIDREKAMKLGVSIDAINRTLQGYTGYTYINDYNQFGKVYKVEIQAKKNYRTSVSDITALYVPNKDGEMVPMSTLVEISNIFGPQYLNRYNMYSSVTISGSAAPGYSSGQAMKAMEEIANKTLPQGMKYEWTDMSYQEKLAGGKIAIIFAFALLFIYLFLVAQYESFMIPLAVMLSVPVAFFGALMFLWVAGLENNIYTQVGFVLLFGLSTKTAILIVEFAKEQHDNQGLSIIEAAKFAAKLRFRAVVMTAVSFILGTFPLVIASGAGAVSRRCLGTAVFGGMTISVIFGTLLVPSFYVVIQKIVERSKRKPQTAK
jgi:HAE1 family hydrophobic/amphiphilic exporter-1